MNSSLFVLSGDRWIFMAGILVIVNLFTGIASAQSGDMNDRIRQLKLGVVKVLPTKPGGVDDEVGAAVVVGGKDDNIYFITAYHVVKKATSISIEPFGKRGSHYSVSLFDNRYDPETDIAVLVANNYQVRGVVNQLYEMDPAGMQSGSRSLLLGHPSQGDWLLRDATVEELTTSRIFVNKGAIERRFSGGPLMDKYGNLIGIVTGIAANGQGEAVRIDVVLGILNRWGVPYNTKLSIDFCDLINRIVEESQNDYDAWKGAQRIPNTNTTYWALNDRKVDITGTGRSILVRSWYVGGTYDISDNPTVYVANFGEQMDKHDALELQNNISKKIVSCLPEKEHIRREGNYCDVISYRRNWLATPISFVVNVASKEVELYMYRGYNVPEYSANSNICDIGANYKPYSHKWPNEW
jgi:hypothetical protein